MSNQAKNNIICKSSLESQKNRKPITFPLKNYSKYNPLGPNEVKIQLEKHPNQTFIHLSFRTYNIFFFFGDNFKQQILEGKKKYHTIYSQGKHTSESSSQTSDIELINT